MYQVIKRRDAALQGLKFFFSGRPCKNGHVALRYVSCGMCTECGKIYSTVTSVRMREARRNREDAASRHNAYVSFEVHPDDVAELRAFVTALNVMRGLPPPAVQSPVQRTSATPEEVQAEMARRNAAYKPEPNGNRIPDYDPR